MTNPTPTPTPKTPQVTTTPLRCLTGAVISGGLGFLLYRLTMSIALTYATKPIVSDNAFALRIASAVRTLVTGVTALAAALFAVAALGLTTLAIQLIIQGFKKPEDSTNG